MPNDTEPARQTSRYMLRIDAATMTIDPEVTIEGHDGHFTLRAPFTEATIMTVPESRIVRPDGSRIDQPRMLGDFQRTGQRIFHLGDYLTRF